MSVGDDVRIGKCTYAYVHMSSVVKKQLEFFFADVEHPMDSCIDTKSIRSCIITTAGKSYKYAVNSVNIC